MAKDPYLHRCVLTILIRYIWRTALLASHVLWRTWLALTPHPKLIARHVDSLIMHHASPGLLNGHFVVCQVWVSTSVVSFHNGIVLAPLRLLTITQALPLLDLELSVLLIVIRV